MSLHAFNEEPAPDRDEVLGDEPRSGEHEIAVPEGRRSAPISCARELAPRSSFERATPWVLGVLGSLFVSLTCMVHLDAGLAPPPPPSPSALRGRDVFRQQYCQGCHQLYGQGGFQGPDLTRVYSRESEARIRVALITGFRDMPRPSLSAREIDDVVAYLAYMDENGHYQEATWPPRGLGK